MIDVAKGMSFDADRYRDTKYEVLGRRLIAFLLDGLIVTVLMAPFDLINAGIWSEIAPTLGAVVYAVVLHAYYGQTLGKRVVGVVVLHRSESRLLRPQEAIVRQFQTIVGLVVFLPFDSTVKLALAVPFGALAISDIIVAWNSEKKRSLHDRVGSSVVVRRSLQDVI